jgi:esterase/lipase superfamily enzyme
MNDIMALLSKLPEGLRLSRDLHVDRVPGCRRVWYCTNRKVLDPSSFDSAKRLSGERGEREYGLCQVQVDPNRHPGQMAKVKGNIPLFQRKEKTVKLRSCQQFTSLEVFLKLRQLHAKTRRRCSLLFVHGFNVGFDAAMERAAQLAEDLHISGEAFVFSWPSQDAITGYVADQDRAEASIDDLVEWKKLIREAMTDWKEHPLHVVAHSMGTRVLTPAVGKMLSGSNPVRHLGEMILAAADADIDKMEDWLAGVSPYVSRVSIYASTTDRALKLSQLLHRSQRFGAQPSPTTLWDVIHCDGEGKDWIKHSYIFETPAVLRDMEDTVNGRDCCERHLISAGEARTWKLVEQ